MHPKGSENYLGKVFNNNDEVDYGNWQTKTWERVDNKAKRFVTTKKDGPDYKNVVRRDTFDADTDELLDVLEQPDLQNKKKTYKAIPGDREIYAQCLRT